MAAIIERSPDLHDAQKGQAVAPAAPIEGDSGLQYESLNLLDGFFKSRSIAEKNPGVRDEELAAVREDVRDWFTRTYPDAIDKRGTVEDYTSQAESSDESMLGGLVSYLSQNHAGEGGASWAELVSSKDFLDATFALNRDARNGVDLSRDEDNYAFVVPVRLSSDNPEYSEEIRPLMHALHYVPDELVPHFMRDLPTFVADRYANGGHLVVAPVTADMRNDLSAESQTDFVKAGRKRVNDAVDLAHALGAVDIGYGATLPGLMRLGKATENKDVTTTTGHGGTTALMNMLVDRVIERMPENERKDLRIGALGLGHIGLSAAEVVAELHPDLQVNVFDTEEKKVQQLVTNGRAGRFNVSEDAAALMRDSDIVISTPTATFDLEDPKHPYRQYLEVAKEDIEGKVIIDDSEPHSFMPEQVTALGGMVVDVIGRDESEQTHRRLTDFAYGGTLADRYRDEFGCGLEVALLNRVRKERRAEGLAEEEVQDEVDSLALDGPVTSDIAKKWLDYFKRYNIGPAPLQAFGKEYKAT